MKLLHSKLKMYDIYIYYCLQDFHSEGVHPPYVGVEDEVIHILPVHSMLFYGFWHDYAIQYTVHSWII